MKINNLKVDKKDTWEKSLSVVKKGIAAMMVGGAMLVSSTPVYAHVNSNDIVFEADHYADTAKIKKQEAKKIKKAFESENIWLPDVEKAIALSDILNTYSPAFNSYSNTNLQEILDLNISSLYDDEEFIKNYGSNYDYNNFCNNNLTNMAAIDGYLTLSCYGVCESMTDTMAFRIEESLKSQGYYPNSTKVYFTNKGAFAICSFGNYNIKANISGNILDELKEQYIYLHNKYQKAYNNISGKSEEYDTTFCTNGFIYNKKAQAYLCVAGDELKSVLSSSIDNIKGLNATASFDVSCENPVYANSLSRTDIKLLRQLGFTDYEINHTTTIDVTLDKVQKQVLAK